MSCELKIMAIHAVKGTPFDIVCWILYEHSNIRRLWWLCESFMEKYRKKTLRNMPSKPRMPIPTSALLRPNVTLKATKEWVWFSSSVSEISFRYESIYASLNLDLTPPFVEQNINIIQVTWSYCSHSHHHLGCNKILRNVEVPKMPSSINQVADGQRDGLLLLQKRFLSKENLCFFFFALKQPYHMSKQIWQMLYKTTLCSELFQMSLTAGFIFFPVHGLFDKPHNRTLLLRGNSAANDLVISTRMSQLLWCGQDVKFVNTCWLWKKWCFPFFKT